MTVLVKTEESILTAKSWLSSLTVLWQSLFGKTAWKSVLGLADQAIVSGTNFLITVIVGRLCGINELGVYALGFSIVILIVNMQESLIFVPYTVYVNHTPKKSRALHTGSIFIQYCLFSVLAVICLIVSATFLSTVFEYNRITTLIWILAGITPFILLREFGRRFAFANLHIAAALIIDLGVVRILISGLVWLGLIAKLSAITTYAVVGLACAIVSLVWLSKFSKSMKVNWSDVKREIKRSLLFGRWVLASQITGTFHGYLMFWMLALMISTSATGAYTACWAIVSIANPLILGIGNVLAPRAARLYAESGSKEVRRVILKTTLLMGGVMILFCVMMFLFGGELMSFFYGNDYEGFESTIRVLAMGIVLSALTITVDIGLRIIEKPNKNFKACLIGLGVTIVVGPYLVVQWGVLGAAYSMLAGSMIALLVRWIAFLRLVDNSYSLD